MGHGTSVHVVIAIIRLFACTAIACTATVNTQTRCGAPAIADPPLPQRGLMHMRMRARKLTVDVHVVSDVNSALIGHLSCSCISSGIHCVMVAAVRCCRGSASEGSACRQQRSPIAQPASHRRSWASCAGLRCTSYLTTR